MTAPDWDRILDILTPTWPIGFDRWESLITLVILALFKIDRGTIMCRRAPYVDRFGWSIIIFDWTLGGLFMLSLLWTLYPATRIDPWLPRVTVLLLLAVTLWQWWEVRHAPQPRVEQVASGVTNGHWDGKTERRNGEPGRREYDFKRAEARNG